MPDRQQLVHHLTEHRAGAAVKYLHQVTPVFISLWLPNSLDLNPADYKV